MKSIAVLASGKGSNLQAIISSIDNDQIQQADIVLVLSDKPMAGALTIAKEHEIECLFLDPFYYTTRNEYEQAIVENFKEKNIDLVVLAGFMRVLSPTIINAYPQRIMNIHPSLLPAFPGVNAVNQALNYGVKISGCTVHFVEEEVDAGPIVLQEAVPVLQEDDVTSLQQRIHSAEHRCYPRAIDLFCREKIIVKGRRCYLYD